jgi:hypothetical protein
MGFAEKGGSDIVFFEVQRDAKNIVGKFQQLTERDFVQPVNAGNTIPSRKNRPDLLDLNRLLVVPDLLLYDAANLGCSYIHK